MAIFQENVPLKNKVLLWIVAIIFAAGMLVAFWAEARGEGALSSAGFAVAMLPILYAVAWSKWKAKHDPAFAQRMEEGRERRRLLTEAQTRTRMKGLVAHAFGFAITLGIMFAMHEAGFSFPRSWHLNPTMVFFALYGLCTAGVLIVQSLRNRSGNPA